MPLVRVIHASRSFHSGRILAGLLDQRTHRVVGDHLPPRLADPAYVVVASFPFTFRSVIASTQTPAAAGTIRSACTKYW
jgi:hypothetical protein